MISWELMEKGTWDEIEITVEITAHFMDLGHTNCRKKMACGPRISWGDQLVPVAAKPADRLGGAKFIGCSSKICFF